MEEVTKLQAKFILNYVPLYAHKHVEIQKTFIAEYFLSPLTNPLSGFPSFINQILSSLYCRIGIDQKLVTERDERHSLSEAPSSGESGVKSNN